MSQAQQAIDPAILTIQQRIVLILIPVIAAVIAVFGSQYPLWIALALVGAISAYAIGKWPEASTLLVVFILYTNSAAIAVEFHGVPFIVGASFIGLLIIPLSYYVLVRRETIVLPSTMVLLILLSAVRLVGAVTAKHPDIAMQELMALVVEGALLYFLIINVVRTPETLRRVIWTLVAAGALISLAPLYQQATGDFDNNIGGFGQMSNAAFNIDSGADSGPVQPRLAGSVGEQNRFAQVMLMLFPLALFRWRGEQHQGLKLFAIVATGLITLAVVLTFSRGAAVGMVAVLFTMAFFRYIQFKHLLWVLAGLSLLLLAIPQYGTRMAKLGGVVAVADSSAGTADGSLQSRFTEMGAAILVYLDHPIIGVGPGMFRYHYRDYAEQIGLRVFAKGRRSHSLYLDLAAETGTTGLLLFSTTVLITLRDLLSSYRRWRTTWPEQANIAASFILVIVAYLTTAIFLHSAYIRFFWLMMALAYAASHVVQEKNSQALPSAQVPA